MVTNGMRQPPLRLTRRGRVVVLTLLMVLASLASAGLFATASRAQDPASGPLPTVVVQPDETLWGIASRALPQRDPFAAVDEIRRLNGLDGSVVHPGQTLRLPQAR